MCAFACGCTGSIGGLRTKGSKETVEKAQACVDDRGGVPTPSPLRRLSLREYVNTVQAITGVDPTEFMTGFPSDFKVSGIFDIEASNGATTASLTSGFYKVARDVSNKAMETATRQTFVGCDPSSTNRDTCLGAFVDRFGTAAWRRPLTTEERTDFVALGKSTSDGWEGVRLIVYAALQSPSFLFRPEFGEDQDNAERPGLMRVSPTELATRLSFLFWGTTPESTFFDTSRLASLKTKDGIRTVVSEMMKDERANTTAQQLFQQWFGLHELSAQRRSTDLYPSFSTALLTSMETEVSNMLVNHGWSQTGNFLDVFTATQTKIDANLSKVYKANVTASTPANFDLASMPDRGGIFSLPGILTLIGRNRDNPSIVSRGKWVKENIFCEHLPPPPAGTEITTPGVNESSAEAAKRHQTDPLCRGCHALVDPIGRGLEKYDAIGAVRTQYPGGQALPTDGALPMLNSAPFQTARELGQLVHGSEGAQRCITEHAWRWIASQKLDMGNASDSCTFDNLHTLMTSKNYNIKEALLEYVTSDAFRFRPPVID